MTTHHITVHEPAWIRHELTLSPDEDEFRDTDYAMDTEIGTAEITEPIFGPEAEHITYECTCGDEFGNDFGSAEQHLVEIQESATGGEVTSLDEAPGDLR